MKMNLSNVASKYSAYSPPVFRGPQAMHCPLLFPNDLAGRYLCLAFTAEKTKAAALEDTGYLLAAGGTVRLHLHFIEFCKRITLFAEIFYPFLIGFLLHHRAACTTYLLFHRSLLCVSECLP